jgi:mannose-6-phosphate isomerase-like protein (cupin superfamily)
MPGRNRVPSLCQIRVPRPARSSASRRHVRGTFALVQGFDVAGAAERMAAQGGGYEVVHESLGLEIGVCVLVAPEPDGQTPHTFDEVYVVLDGEGDIEVEGELRHVSEGDAVFVAARADHRFSGYESLSLLVVFNGPQSKPA